MKGGNGVDLKIDVHTEEFMEVLEKLVRKVVKEELTEYDDKIQSMQLKIDSIQTNDSESFIYCAKNLKKDIS